MRKGARNTRRYLKYISILLGATMVVATLETPIARWSNRCGDTCTGIYAYPMTVLCDDADAPSCARPYLWGEWSAGYGQTAKVMNGNIHQPLGYNPRDNDEICPMLLENHCVIYTARPIICRTHGLPILYHEAERAFVDYCRLNFTKIPKSHKFEKKYILDMNSFNVQLIEIDKKFSDHILEKKWRPDNRKSLKSVLFNLKL